MMLPLSRSLGSTCHCRNIALRRGNPVSMTGCWGPLSSFLQGRSPVAQGEPMTKVRWADAFKTGMPWSKTRKLMLMSVPTGWLVLMAQFARPIRLNSCPVCTGDVLGTSKVTEAATAHRTRGNLHI